ARGAAALAGPAPPGGRALGGRARADGRPRGGRRDRRARPHRELARARPRHRAGWDIAVEGLVSGEASLTGRRSEALGSVHLTSGAGRYYGVPYEDLELRALLHGRVTEVTAGRA